MQSIYLKQSNGSLYPVTVIAIGREHGDAIIELSEGRRIVVRLAELVFVEMSPAFPFKYKTNKTNV